MHVEPHIRSLRMPRKCAAWRTKARLFDGGLFGGGLFAGGLFAGGFAIRLAVRAFGDVPWSEITARWLGCQPPSVSASSFSCV